MGVSAESMERLIRERVNSGVPPSEEVAETELKAKPTEREIDAKIRRGLDDVRAKRPRESNPKNNEAFLKKLEGKLLSEIRRIPGHKTEELLTEPSGR